MYPCDSSGREMGDLMDGRTEGYVAAEDKFCYDTYTAEE